MANVWGLRQYFYQKCYQTFKFSGEIWPRNSVILNSNVAIFTLNFLSSSHYPDWLTSAPEEKLHTLQFYLWLFWDSTAKFKNQVDF